MRRLAGAGVGKLEGARPPMTPASRPDAFHRERFAAGASRPRIAKAIALDEIALASIVSMLVKRSEK